MRSGRSRSQNRNKKPATSAGSCGAGADLLGSSLLGSSSGSGLLGRCGNLGGSLDVRFGDVGQLLGHRGHLVESLGRCAEHGLHGGGENIATDRGGGLGLGNSRFGRLGKGGVLGFHDRGDFLLHFGNQVVNAARVGHHLVDVWLGQFAVQLGDGGGVLGRHQLLGVGNGIVEKFTGSSHVERSQSLDTVESGAHQGHHDFSIGFLRSGQLFDIRVAHHLLQFECVVPTKQKPPLSRGLNLFYFLPLVPALTALTVAFVAATTFASVISATCLAALVMLSKAELAAAITLFTAATATSDPAGADLAALSSRPATFFWNSPNCASTILESSS